MHSALAGRLNAEGAKFLSNIFHVKKKQIYKNKFYNLVHRAIPGVFTQDVEKDKGHNRVSLSDFKFVDFKGRPKEDINIKFTAKRSQSFKDLPVRQTDDQPQVELRRAGLINHVRRKS